MKQDASTYQFPQAAAAIGVTVAALRNWVHRDRLPIWDDRGEGDWRTFTESQIIALAMTGELVRHKIRVRHAYLAVLDAITVHCGNGDIDALPKKLTVSYHEDGVSLDHAGSPLDLFGEVVRFDIRTGETPEPYNHPRSELAIFPQRIIADTRERLMRQ